MLSKQRTYSCNTAKKRFDKNNEYTYIHMLYVIAIVTESLNVEKPCLSTMYEYHFNESYVIHTVYFLQ